MYDIIKSNYCFLKLLNYHIISTSGINWLLNIHYYNIKTCKLRYKKTHDWEYLYPNFNIFRVTYAFNRHQSLNYL